LKIIEKDTYVKFKGNRKIGRQMFEGLIPKLVTT